MACLPKHGVPGVWVRNYFFFRLSNSVQHFKLSALSNARQQ